MFKKTIFLLLMVIINTLVHGQTLTYSFTDPCTKVTSFFSVPATGTTIFFLNKSATFTSADVASGAFGSWINQTYADYRKVMPCSVQSTQVVQNQITSQIIGSTVQSVIGSIMGSAQSAAMSTTASSSGGDDAASKGKTESDKKKNKNGSTSNNNSSSSNANNGNNSTSSGSSATSAANAQSTGNDNSSTSNPTTTPSSGTSNNSGSNSNNGTSSTNSTQSKTGDQKGEEVVGSMSMSIDAHNGGESSSSSESGGKGGKAGGSARSNPILVSSDLTTAQNLDRTFTPILNLGMAQSSMTGMSSWGLTGMIWFNFKQFALSSRYTKIHFSRGGKLKFIHNFNLTGVYSYGNVLGFVGYSGILNAGKWGVTGFNISAAGTLVSENKNTFISPSITAFYTRPFAATKRLSVSPELYIISTPLMYSTQDKVTTTDRTFSAFIGSGFDYQITKRFKFNFNYKMNMSTNPDFPILSFFLIGSKINL